MNKTLRGRPGNLRLRSDRTGASSHPLSIEITIGAEAYVLHQIVTWLHKDFGYVKVNLVGHSLGSVIAIEEAGQYHDSAAWCHRTPAPP